MKTLSFVKQAMAVALLISAVNASAGVTDLLKSAGSLVVRGWEMPARLTGKAFGYVPCWRTSKVASTQTKNTEGKYVATDDTLHDSLEAMQTANKEPKMTVEIPAKVTYVSEAVAKKFATTRPGRYLANPENARVKTAALCFASTAIVAGLIYGGYKLYNKFFAKTEAEDEVQEEVEPVVETTETVVAQPARKKIVNDQPAA